MPRDQLSRRLRAVRDLSITEWIVLVQAAIGIPIVIALLRLRGLKDTQQLLARIAKPGPRNDVGAARPIVRMITIAGSFGLLRPNCLQRSLVAWTILRRRSFDPQLRIGVGPPKGGPDLRFHAWVELGGQVVNDRADIASEFKPFDAAVVPGAGAFDR
ncbi:MAG: lasso peptide biosynthesis B2 protein [Acidimicrobiia bacterium]|nr:lasso peptide biosynthesis B2 protein [Acidimicrobiia bacterium]